MLTLTIAAGTLAAGVVAPQSAALAYSGNCGSSSINPKNARTGVSNYRAFKPVTFHGRRIQIMAGRNHWGQYGWAEMSGRTTARDRVWMDWRTSPRQRHRQCGPERVGRSGARGFTRALPTGGPSVQFRACGDLYVAGKRTHKCTGWW
ncbi:hypothetical protein MB27_29615 [Actinoplanes utahensis]|uniref:Uncharacterized protein n=2 Tax=Actinoplanes utahensis TaxID=1869 RepID=A0A0A6UE36_ACTUT|nr:hypothetical protein MB27_29615 [Actinoplanes utahensis]